MKFTEKKVVMISGANRGIGKVIAEKLSEDGYLLSLGIRNLDSLPRSLSSVPKTKLLCNAYDAKVPQSAKSWIDETIKHFGRIDVLINNAGVLHSIGLEDDSEELLDEMWEVNAKAPLRLTRLVFPYLRKSGSGRVIDIISMSGKRVKGNWVGYSMSKYAALAASHTARIQGWEDGIRVTAVCPGYVQSKMTEIHAPNVNQEIMSRPQDIARIISILLLLPNESNVPEILMNCVSEPV